MDTNPDGKATEPTAAPYGDADGTDSDDNTDNALGDLNDSDGGADGLQSDNTSAHTAAVAGPAQGLDSLLVGVTEQALLEERLGAELMEELKKKENANDERRLRRAADRLRRAEQDLKACRTALQRPDLSSSQRKILLDRRREDEAQLKEIREEMDETALRISSRSRPEGQPGPSTETEREKLIRTGKITPFEAPRPQNDSTDTGIPTAIEQDSTSDDRTVADLTAGRVAATSGPMRRTLKRKQPADVPLSSRNETDVDPWSNEPATSSSDIDSDPDFNPGGEGSAPKRSSRRRIEDDDQSEGDHSSNSTESDRAEGLDESRAFDDGDEFVYQRRMDLFVDEIRRDQRDSRDLNENISADDAAHIPHPRDLALEGGYILPGQVNSRLFSYQRTCVRWLWELHQQEVGGVLGDEMGLGKTVQIAAFLAGLHRSRRLSRPTIIVAPATVLSQWTPHRIILSGTPVQNNLKELWSVYDFVYPGRLGTLPVFLTQFEVPIRLGARANASHVEIQTARRCAAVLRDLISPYLLRRLKKDVASDLPQKTELVLFCKLVPQQVAAYRQFLDSSDVRAVLDGRKNVLAAIDAVRKICNHPDLLNSTEAEKKTLEEYGSCKRSGKMLVVRELLKTWSNQGHRTLLFCQTRQMQDILEKFIRTERLPYRRMDGSTPVGARAGLVDEFNRDTSIRVFLLTTRVGGIGVNLTGADRNPSTDAQARERAWRLGQTRPVLIYRLMTAGTIEEKIYHRQVYKQFLAHQVLQRADGSSTAASARRFFDANTIRDLFTLDVPGDEPDSRRGAAAGKRGTLTSRMFSGAETMAEPRGAAARGSLAATSTPPRTLAAPRPRSADRPPERRAVNDDASAGIAGVEGVEEFALSAGETAEAEGAEAGAGGTEGDGGEVRMLAELLHSTVSHDRVLAAAGAAGDEADAEAQRVAAAAARELRRSRQALRAARARAATDATDATAVAAVGADEPDAAAAARAAVVTWT
ncbi:hypothetical protein HK405_008892, partial [Cladochytrium tenue]